MKGSSLPFIENSEKVFAQSKKEENDKGSIMQMSRTRCTAGGSDNLGVIEFGGVPILANGLTL